MHKELLTITMNWEDKSNKGKLTSIKNYMVVGDTFIANTNNGHQVILSSDMKYGYCMHLFSGTGKVTEKGRTPCKHIWELREIIERVIGVSEYNWISLSSIQEFLETEGISQTGSSSTGIAYERKHIDVYSMKCENGEWIPDWLQSPEVKVEDFKDLLLQIFGKEHERKWIKFSVGEWRSD